MELNVAQPHSSKKTWIIIGGVLALLVVGAAVFLGNSKSQKGALIEGEDFYTQVAKVQTEITASYNFVEITYRTIEKKIAAYRVELGKKYPNMEVFLDPEIQRLFNRAATIFTEADTDKASALTMASDLYDSYNSSGFSDETKNLFADFEAKVVAMDARSAEIFQISKDLDAKLQPAPLPNLMIEYVTPNNDAQKTFQIGVKNTGEVVAENFKIKFVLNNEACAAHYKAEGGEEYITVEALQPEGIAGYLGKAYGCNNGDAAVIVDEDNAVEESNEEDNKQTVVLVTAQDPPPAPGGGMMMGMRGDMGGPRVCDIANPADIRVTTNPYETFSGEIEQPGTGFFLAKYKIETKNCILPLNDITLVPYGKDAYVTINSSTREEFEDRMMAAAGEQTSLCGTEGSGVKIKLSHDGYFYYVNNDNNPDNDKQQADDGRINPNSTATIVIQSIVDGFYKGGKIQLALTEINGKETDGQILGGVITFDDKVSDPYSFVGSVPETCK